MIFGIGTDIVSVQRFEKWLLKPAMLDRYFNEEELLDEKNFSDGIRKDAFCQHYAARFAAKEAFSKALGTGLRGFSLKEVFVRKEESGKPVIAVTGRAKQLLEELAGKDARVHLSISHEKDHALAFVIIERG